MLHVQWKRGVDEPIAVLDGRTMHISLIFELGQRRDAREHGGTLRAYASRNAERAHEFGGLTLLPTYEVAARCLLKWVDEKKPRSR